jgi:hypothetical protein
LEAALRTIARSSRNTIFLAAGEYSVSSADFTDNLLTAWNGRLSVIGGYDPETWAATDARSSVELSDGREIPLGGTLRLEQLSFSQPLRISSGGKPPVIDMRRVEVRPAGGDNTPAIVQAGGMISLFDSVVTQAIDIQEGATFEATGSSLDAVSIRGGMASIGDSIMAGARISAGSSLSVTESRITADHSVDVGGLLYVEESTLQIRSSAVHSISDDPILIRGRNSDIQVTGSVISGEGTRSAIAIRTRGGTVEVSDTVIDIASNGYGYGLFFRDSDAEITGSTVLTRVAGDGIGVAAGDSTVSITNSLLWITGIGERQVTTATGITVDGNGIDDLVVRDSQLLAHGVVGGTSSAVRLGSEGAARVSGNSFGGWRFTLVQGPTIDRWEQAGRLTSVDDLNRSRFGTDNRSVETLRPPDRVTTPAIPDASLPEYLLRLRNAAGR